jgi:hypothetical protein
MTFSQLGKVSARRNSPSSLGCRGPTSAANRNKEEGARKGRAERIPRFYKASTRGNKY